jgi:hypothetical protein
VPKYNWKKHKRRITSWTFESIQADPLQGLRVFIDGQEITENQNPTSSTNNYVETTFIGTGCNLHMGVQTIPVARNLHHGTHTLRIQRNDQV